MKCIGNIVRYLCLIAIDIAIMLLFHSYLNFIILLALLLFPIYSLFGAYRVKNQFSLQLYTPLEPMKKGEEFQVRIVLDNPTWFPLLNATLQLEVTNAFYGVEGKNTLNFPVRAHQKTEVVYPIVMDYSGHFCVSTKSIQLRDLLGLYEWKVDLSNVAECLVLPVGAPRNQEAGHIYMQGVTEAMESKEKGYDFSEISGIREYIPGDKLQNIHWKLSVKKDELMVKERVSVSAMQLHVLVEIANDEEMRADCVLDLADSVTRSFVTQNLPFTVYYYSSNLQAMRSCYIGNEIERAQWLEMVLYDKCYDAVGRIEDIFFQEHMETNLYLYIGYGAQESENVIYGEKETVAELRRRG